jgi:cobalt/nickel transport protein
MREPAQHRKQTSRRDHGCAWLSYARAGLCGVLVGLTHVVVAHDFWLEVQPSAMDVCGEHTVTIRNGSLFEGDSVPRIDDWFTRFSVIRPDNSQTPVRGVIGDDPAGRFHARMSGTHTVLYSSTSAFAELDGARFTRYLEEEGLDEVVALRARLGQSGDVAREVFYRHAKALVAIGEAPLADAPRGQELELVMESTGINTYGFTVRFRGQALAGVRVVLMRRGHDAVLHRADTDHRGQVQLPLMSPGYYLVKAVHAVPAPPGSGLTDWISYWASSTFTHRPKN